MFIPLLDPHLQLSLKETGLNKNFARSCRWLFVARDLSKSKTAHSICTNKKGMIGSATSTNEKRSNTMTNKFELDVQGTAVYLELRKNGATAQILLTPDGFGENGIISSQFFRRVVTAGVSKRRWKAYGINLQQNQRDLIAEGTGLTPEGSEGSQEITATRTRVLNDYFTSMVRNGYKLVQDKPIYVEVTKDDLEQIKQGTLPTKLWTRVKSSRTALGFPETATD